ncbi:ferritin-like domain-containing protein [Pseudotabrizicola algicola]|uniref:Ferritin-like domain-containing protein n=1 Tax=Pseudotabrizicola algicola TaxID=2709381 RepID=A0A6B3RR24_9RHOB|nr:ferritin-like domain-containing protein [Pseudotabrizicola algicola]NEX47911.1 ferritin-like domain-containing protein [Pseudotabrizicola algicola]
MADTTSAQDLFIVGLRNAHAMEKQALSIIQPQLNRLEHYPQVAELLERHLHETEGQIVRLDEVMQSLDATSSGLKDASLSIAGSMAALSHTIADDEILKNSFANFAFEHYEIASYMSLISMAEASGATSAISLLENSLDEERRMAAAIRDTLEPVTRRYMSLRASGERADI